MKKTWIFIVMILILVVTVLPACGIPQAELDKANATITQLTGERDQLKKDNSQLTTELELAKKKQSYGSSLKDPTEEQLNVFLASDYTNTFKFSAPGTYAEILFVQAMAAGWRPYITWIRVGGQKDRWYFTSFDVIGKGRVHILANQDKFVKLEKGTNYYTVNGFSPLPSYDTTIVEMGSFP